MPNKRYNDFIKWNDEMIKKFDLEHYHANPNFIVRFIEYKRVKYILNFLETNVKDTIIEIGCGAGDILNKINKGNLTGLDISEYILDIGKKRYKNIKFVIGNVENLPPEISQSQYDKIICSEVLEHVENPDKVLREMKKLAKQNSIIVVSVPNEKLIDKIKSILQKLRVFTLFFPKIPKKMDEEWHLHRFDLDKLKRKVSQNYIIEDIQGVPYNWLPLRYVIKMRIK